MRIGVAGFAHEANSFSSQPTTLEDFGVSEGGGSEGRVRTGLGPAH